MTVRMEANPASLPGAFISLPPPTLQPRGRKGRHWKQGWAKSIALPGQEMPSFV